MEDTKQQQDTLEANMLLLMQAIIAQKLANKTVEFIDDEIHNITEDKIK